MAAEPHPMLAPPERRRLPIGAEASAAGVHFRVWAPRRQRVEVVIEGGPHFGAAFAFELAPEQASGGYFSGFLQGAGHGTRYRYRLDGKEGPFPDPASRFQPDGPHGSSCVIDPARFIWTDGDWKGVRIEGQVIYELHIGAFTPEGTWQSAMRELGRLRELGITVLEVMPVGDFPGRFGWGYDGVNLYAPTRLYGEPDDFRRFIDAAHQAELAVILDVVYNHLGPDGNYLRQYAEQYFSARYTNEWGEAINFDGADAGPVREYFISNARYFIDEFHLDGLRIDATQTIFDDSPENVLAALTEQARQAAAGRSILIIAEDETQRAELVRKKERGGYGMDALWNDDFHHSAMVAFTGHREAYFSDYKGAPQEFISAMKWGYLFQGQRYVWQQKCRGTPALDIKPASFVTYLQNHDQVANSARGLRCQKLTSPGCYRALTVLLLLGPATPMLFMGQEFAASSPFLYFADHHPELADLVKKGRSAFLMQFPSLAQPDVKDCLPDPGAPETFAQCKLDFSERERNHEALALHRDLLALRKRDGVFSAQRPRGLDGAALSPSAFVLRFFGEHAGDDRLLFVNLGIDLHLAPAPEPLLAAPQNRGWELLFSSETPRYGGSGTPKLSKCGDFHLIGQAAVVMTAKDLEKENVHEGARAANALAGGRSENPQESGRS